MTRKEAVDILWRYDVYFEPHTAEEVMHAIDIAIEALNAQPETHDKRTETHSCDLISRQDAIDALTEYGNGRSVYIGVEEAVRRIEQLTSAQPERKYTLEEVAEILASVIGDECACNINGIDEWLPERCKYTEIGEECPNPKEKHGCWMQFLLQGGAQI